MSCVEHKLNLLFFCKGIIALFQYIRTKTQTHISNILNLTTSHSHKRSNYWYFSFSSNNFDILIAVEGKLIEMILTEHHRHVYLFTKADRIFCISKLLAVLLTGEVASRPDWQIINILTNRLHYYNINSMKNY